MALQVEADFAASVGATSTRTTLSGKGPVVFCRLASGSTTTVYVKFGDSTVTATTSDTAVPVNVPVTLMVPTGATDIAHIGSAAGPSTLQMSRGWETK